MNLFVRLGGFGLEVRLGGPGWLRGASWRAGFGLEVRFGGLGWA